MKFPGHILCKSQKPSISDGTCALTESPYGRKYEVRPKILNII
jgi:hypothetical protein